MSEIVSGDSDSYIRQNERNLVSARMHAPTLANPTPLTAVPTSGVSKGDLYWVGGTVTAFAGTHWNGITAYSLVVALGDNPTEATGWALIPSVEGMVINTGGASSAQLTAQSDGSWASSNAGQQGYLSIATAYMSGGAATDTTIAIADVDTWMDLSFTVDATVDKRPDTMVAAQATAYDAAAKTLTLEGLSSSSFASVSPSFSFDPDEDDGELSIRLLLTSHSGASSASSSVENVIATMAQGADEDYVFQPSISFPVTEDLDTNAGSDAGTIKVQVKSTVAGTVSMREINYFFYS